MENNNKKGLKICIIIIVIVALLASVIKFTVHASKSVYFSVFNSVNKTVSGLVEDPNSFTVVATGEIETKNSEDSKELDEVLNNAKFNFSLQEEREITKAKIDIKNKNNEDLFNSVINVDLRDNGMYIKINQLSDKWIKISDKDTEDFFSKLNNLSKEDSNSEAIQSRITNIVTNSIMRNFSNLRFEKSKEKIQFKGKEVNATKHSVCIDTTQMYMMADSIASDIAKDEEMKSLFENQEDVNKLFEDYNFDNMDEELTTLDDFFDFDFDLDDDDEDEDEDEEDLDETEDEDEEEEERIQDQTYGAIKISVYTKGFFKKKFVGASIENYECNSVDACDSEKIEEAGIKESEIKLTVVDKNKYLVDYKKYDVNSNVIESIECRVETNLKEKIFNYEVVADSVNIPFSKVKGQIIFASDTIIDTYSPNNVVDGNSVDFDKIFEIDFIKKLNSYFENIKDKQSDFENILENQKKEKNDEKYKSESNEKDYNKILEEYNGKEINGSKALEILDTIIENNSKEGNNIIKARINSKLYEAIDELKKEINKKDSYRVVLDFTTDDKISMFELFSK